MCNFKNSKSFTLIELMLASLIISLIMLSVYGSVLGGLRAWREGSSRTERHQMIQIALEEISRELRGAYIASNNPQIKFVGELEKMDFVYATATSDRGQLPQASYDLCLVSYYLTEEEEWQLRKLMRQGSMIPYAFEFPSVSLMEEEDSKLMSEERTIPYTEEFSSVSAEEIINSVFSLGFRYYSQGEWQEAWDSNRDLPQTVQISLVLQDEKGSKETFSTMVDVPGGG